MLAENQVSPTPALVEASGTPKSDDATVTILTILKALSSWVLLAIDAIDKVKQADAAEIQALKKLKTAISAVDNDISTFTSLISPLQSFENERPYSAFIERCAATLRFALGTTISHVSFQTGCQGRNE